MDEVEFRLWDALEGGPREYGRMTLSIEQLDGLRALADEIGGWVMFNDESGEEEFVPSARWQDLYADWLAQKTARRSGPR